MPFIRPQTAGERRVDLRNLNKVLRGVRRGDFVGVGPGMTKSVHGGRVVVRTVPQPQPGWEPFEPRVQDKAGRVVRVNTGRVLLNAYIFTGSSFSSGYADLTVSSTSGDYWVCLKIGTSAATYGTVELDSSTTAPEARGWALWDQYRLIPLALVTISGARIQGMERLHFGGDVSVVEDYPGIMKMISGAGYGLANAGVFTGYIDLPPGWRPADGTDSVPDFAGRFPIMIDITDSTTPLDSMNLTGGAATHTHTIGLQADFGNAVSGSQIPTNTTGSAGNLPPYKVTLFIVKI